MKKNMGQADRVIRIVTAIVIAGLYFLNVIAGTLAVVLLIFAAVFIITGFIGFCPLYYPFGLSTKNRTGNKREPV